MMIPCVGRRGHLARLECRRRAFTKINNEQNLSLLDYRFERYCKATKTTKRAGEEDGKLIGYCIEPQTEPADILTSRLAVTEHDSNVDPLRVRRRIEWTRSHKD